MDQRIKKISSQIVNSYSPDTNVIGIMLFGSAARNKFDAHSDVDIYILLKKKINISRKNYVVDDLRVDIIFETLTETKKYLNNDKNSLRRITSHMIANGRILFQRGNQLTRIQKIACNNLKLRTKYSKNEILMHKYSIDDFWGEVQRDIKNKDSIAFGIDSQLLIINIIELFLKLKGWVYPQPNEMKQTLQYIDKKFSQEVNNFFSASSQEKKLSILSRLTTDIYERSGGPLKKTWSIKE